MNLSNWKEILTGIGAACVVILQIVNVLLSSDIDNNIALKAKLVEQKAADMRELVERTETEIRALNVDKKP